jgi:ribose-phosphate pyrophosphokinase
VAGRDVIVVDDEIANGGSMIELIHHLRREGARTIRIACTHGIFARDAVERLTAQPDLIELVCTDTMPIAAAGKSPKLTVLSIAPALAEAMRRINTGESVSALFQEPPKDEKIVAVG